MTDRLQKKDMVQRLVRRMGTDEQTAAAWLGAFIDTLYEAFKEGRSVTLPASVIPMSDRTVRRGPSNSIPVKSSEPCSGGRHPTRGSRNSVEGGTMVGVKKMMPASIVSTWK